LSSNGSTSMASVCGSTLALMDAGVPIRPRLQALRWALLRMATSRRKTCATRSERHPGPGRSPGRHGFKVAAPSTASPRSRWTSNP
jgi:hypothetical protein